MLDALRRHATAWIQALRRERRRVPPPARPREELAFLPPVVELLERPPSPVGRGIAIAIMGLFAIALLWAALGELDIHATAPGRVVAVGGVQLVQPVETAAVRRLLVHDGARVEAGQLLLELDATAAAADSERLAREKAEASVTAARLRALLALVERDGLDPASLFDPPADAPIELVRVHRLLLDSRVAELRAQRAALEREQEQRAAELRRARADVARLQASVPLLAEQLKARRDLQEHGHAARLVVLEVERTYVERQGDLAAAHHNVEEAQAALAQRRGQAEQKIRADALAELAEAERLAEAAEKELAKARRRVELAGLTAPVAGVVQQLAVHTVGGVVTPAQPVLVIVPRDAETEVEAWLANKDAGFVREGQPVELKVDTFPFTRYGTLRGRVAHVSRDAVPVQDAARLGAPTGDGTGAPLYRVRVALEENTLLVDGRTETLTPGMAVVAEIKTGRRPIIDYLLSPLRRYGKEGLRER